jgi:hypothetical protein
LLHYIVYDLIFVSHIGVVCNISHSLLAFYDINIQDKFPGGVLVLVLETKFNLYDNQQVKNKSNTTDATSGV